LLSLLASCSVVSDWGTRERIRDSLHQGQLSLASADYQTSLKQYERVLSLAPGRAPSDFAWFNIGVIYAHPFNPERDAQKAFSSFNHVIADYPSSAWWQQSRAWVGVLEEENKSREEMERSKQMIEQSNEELNRSKQELERSKQELEKSKQQYERARAELEKSRQEVEKTKQVIEKSRQVDIEIEQKKRARGR